MSDWTVAIAELKDFVRETVREALRPTGVVPGVYSSVTVDPLGRVRFGTAGAGGGMTLVGVAEGSASNFPGTVPSEEERVINYDIVLYDPGSAITTGTAWHYTAPATGWYAVHVAATIRRLNSGQGSIFAQPWDTYLFVEATGSTVQPPTAADTNNFAVVTQNMDVFLRGWAWCYVSAGGTIAGYIGQNNTAGGTMGYRADAIAIYQC